MNSTQASLAIAGLAGLALIAGLVGDLGRGPPATEAAEAGAPGPERAGFAFDEMTEPQRKVFRAEIRDYLLENPQVIMDAVAVLEERQSRQQAEDDAETVAANAGAIFEDGHSWVGGNPDGDVTLVEFMDYRCDYCRRAAPVVDELVENDGDIRFVLKEFPILGEQSVTAARFAIATKQIAGDEAYKSLHDALIAYEGEVNETVLKRLGETLDLASEQILAHMDSPEVSEVIAENHRLAESLGISGTPSFVLGDQLLRGFLPRAEMAELVAELRTDG